LASCFRAICGAATDVEFANRLGCRVRICKGAYQEPPTVAFPDKRDVDESYVRCMQALMSDGNYPGIATHDERMIAAAKRFAAEKGIGVHRYEFQMLYGVRRDLQDQLVREEYRMRVYVPFGASGILPDAPLAQRFGERGLHDG
jgi:proline dehydrogenase